jgi:hypothetical protein
VIFTSIVYEKFIDIDVDGMPVANIAFEWENEVIWRYTF